MSKRKKIYVKSPLERSETDDDLDFIKELVLVSIWGLLVFLCVRLILLI